MRLVMTNEMDEFRNTRNAICQSEINDPFSVTRYVWEIVVGGKEPKTVLDIRVLKCTYRKQAYPEKISCGLQLCRSEHVH